MQRRAFLTAAAAAAFAVPAMAKPLLPSRGPAAALWADEVVISRIGVGSCMEETTPAPIFTAVEAARPDLFLNIGDNLYGDDKTGDPSLPILTKAYADLARNADFAALSRRIPMLAMWDDHDYGLNDAGGDWPGRDRSESLFEAFWGEASLGGGRPGVYGARAFGPAGKRVQIILLDTRFFRSPLKDTDQRNAPGRERYLPETDPTKTMLGQAQWAWLAETLRQPADVRLIVSSIQVLADAHGWEAWRTLPVEQARLYQVIRDSGAKGVVMISGDRHLAALYRQEGLAAYPLYEMTASSLNKSFRATSEEMSSNQIGDAYALVNFGLVDIDWPGRSLRLSIRGLDGAEVRGVDVAFSAIGL